jgi:hypothetical protein
MNSSQNVVRLDAYKKSRLPPKVVAPKLSDLSFVKQGRKRGDGYRCWVVEPSGNYGANCKTGNALALEYLKFLTKAAFPLQWIEFEMPREAERTGIEVGFLGVVTRAAALVALAVGDHLPELLNPDN